MRIEYRLLSLEERKDKICFNCNTDKSVKYLLKSNNQTYCNVCMVQLVAKGIKLTIQTKLYEML